MKHQLPIYRILCKSTAIVPCSLITTYESKSNQAIRCVPRAQWHTRAAAQGRMCRVAERQSLGGGTKKRSRNPCNGLDRVDMADVVYKMVKFSWLTNKEESA